MSVQANLGDWSKIESALSDLKMASLRKEGLRLEWTIKLLNQYEKTVKEAMGSIDAIGSYLRLSFHGINKQEYWKNLSPYTLRVKYRRKHGKPFKGTNDEAYAQLKWEFQIWKDSGHTRSKVSSKYGGNFAGIAGDSDALYRASRTEDGGEGGKGVIPQRRLFAVANEMFTEALAKAFSNENDPLVVALRSEVIGMLREAGWGKGKGRQK